MANVVGGNLENNLFEDRSKFKYMLFQLGSEMYGTPILQVREVIENRSPKPVPNSKINFEGVINLRGEVIGVIDLRKILKVEPKQSLSILIFDTAQGVMGAIVDKCIAVAEIPEKDIDESGGVGQREGGDYFLGIGKRETGMVTLIDLSRVPQVLSHATGGANP
jgi:purine-binding chemotaxis protein CheW